MIANWLKCYDGFWEFPSCEACGVGTDGLLLCPQFVGDLQGFFCKEDVHEGLLLGWDERSLLFRCWLCFCCLGQGFGWRFLCLDCYVAFLLWLCRSQTTRVSLANITCVVGS